MVLHYSLLYWDSSRPDTDLPLERSTKAFCESSPPSQTVVVYIAKCRDGSLAVAWNQRSQARKSIEYSNEKIVRSYRIRDDDEIITPVLRECVSYVSGEISLADLDVRLLSMNVSNDEQLFTDRLRRKPESREDSGFSTGSITI